MNEEKNNTVILSTEEQSQTVEEPVKEEKEAVSFKKRILIEVLEFFKVFFIVLSLWWICNLYFFEVNLVLGRSMNPTLQDSDRIVVNKIGMHFRTLQRGDIVTLDGKSIEAQYDDKFLIKRIIGVPGDRVQIKDGQVYLNGELLNEAYLNGLAFTMSGFYNDEVLGEDEYYVLGDNRSHSTDSRIFGVVKRKAIKGYLIFRFFPFERIGLVE